jgi:hypothetical protein
MKLGDKYYYDHPEIGYIEISKETHDHLESLKTVRMKDGKRVGRVMVFGTMSDERDFEKLWHNPLIEAQMMFDRMETVNDYYNPAPIELWDLELEKLRRRIHWKIDEWLANEKKRGERQEWRDYHNLNVIAFRARRSGLSYKFPLPPNNNT